MCPYFSFLSGFAGAWLGGEPPIEGDGVAAAGASELGALLPPPSEPRPGPGELWLGCANGLFRRQAGKAAALASDEGVPPGQWDKVAADANEGEHGWRRLGLTRKRTVSNIS